MSKNTGATLNIVERSDLALGCRVIEVDCQHALTTITVLPGPTPLSEEALVRVALLKHHDEEGCRCTRYLMQRYGLPVA